MIKYLPICLFVVSIGCLMPGLTQPLITIEATVEKQNMLELAAQAMSSPQQQGGFIQTMVQSMLAQLKVEGSVIVFSSTRSLLGTMQELVGSGHIIVGVLIGLFGVLIPVLKILLTATSFFMSTRQNMLLKVSSVLGKWSMSDVFVMALMVAFLAINANEGSVNTVQMSAKLGPGFYFFAGYCLLAIAAGQLLQRQSQRALQEA
ncbi:MAG: paraquat-inducible protein A [Pseudomonadales bacterium]|nr:paraquat-inducible protein A [Pseudomonadales bacterium]